MSLLSAPLEAFLAIHETATVKGAAERLGIGQAGVGT
jgi:DNA-binding transcriptional LysR family regulator